MQIKNNKIQYLTTASVSETEKMDTFTLLRRLKPLKEQSESTSKL